MDLDLVNRFTPKGPRQLMGKIVILTISCGYMSEFLLAMVMPFFKIVTSPVCGENHLCSYLAQVMQQLKKSQETNITRK